MVLDVTNSKNEDVKQITCPKCKAVLQVKFHKQAPLEAETYYAPPKPKTQAPDYGATQLAGGNNGATILGGAMAGATQLGPSPKKESSARLVYEDMPYFLEEGQNIVGRQYANLIALAKFQENLSRELSVSVGFLAGYIASAHIYEYDFGFANSVVSGHPTRLKDRFYSSGPCSIRSNKLFH